MARLIDANKLKAHYSWWKDGTREMTMGEAKDIFDEIVDMQPTVDAVPVVRCKDCHWRTGLEEHTAWHPCDEVAVNDNWFCADGERRNDETD